MKQSRYRRIPQIVCFPAFTIRNNEQTNKMKMFLSQWYYSNDRPLLAVQTKRHTTGRIRKCIIEPSITAEQSREADLYSLLFEFHQNASNNGEWRPENKWIISSTLSVEIRNGTSSTLPRGKRTGVQLWFLLCKHLVREGVPRIPFWRKVVGLRKIYYQRIKNFDLCILLSQILVNSSGLGGKKYHRVDGKSIDSIKNVLW